MSDAPRLIATPSQTVGPFFHFGLTQDARAVMQPLEGEQIEVHIRVTDGDGTPVDDAMLELWQTSGVNPDAVTPGESDRRGAAAFGRLPTAHDGTCVFVTAHPPGRVDAAGTRHAAHINIYLFARGLLRNLHTRMYFAGDPDLDGDPVLALVPAGRRRTLLAQRDLEHAGRWRFDLRLQGADETVFFDA